MENYFKSVYPYKDGVTPDRMSGMEIDRNLEKYLSTFHYKIDELKGKKILDVGSGAAVFATEANKNGLSVVSMDAAYNHEIGLNWLEKTESSNKTFGEKAKEVITRRKLHPSNPVCAEAENLPFGNESFDVIFNLCAAYHYCTSAEDLRKIFSEQLRVLKSDGEISIYPLIEFQRYMNEDNTLEINGKKIVIQISAYNHERDENTSDILTNEFRLILEDIKNNSDFKMEIFRNRDEQNKTDYFALRIKKLI